MAVSAEVLARHGVTELSRTRAFGCAVCRYEHGSGGVLVWLSGLTCTDENFVVKAGAARSAAQHGVAIACADTSPRGAGAPDEDESWDFGTGAGFYVDATQPEYEKYRMRSYIVDEFVPLVQALTNTTKVAVSGHSMGGMGALQLALKNPALFTSVSAFAPICHPSVVPWGRKCFGRYLGHADGEDTAKPSALWKQYDPTELILAAAKPSKFPSILVHQGADDQFAQNQLCLPDLVNACKQAGQPLDAHVEDGYDHSYFFVQTFIDQHVEFHATAMRKE